MNASIFTRKDQQIETPALIKFLFNDTRTSILWLVVRVWLGWEWIQSSLPKLSNPAWMETGAAVKGFWTGAVQVPAEGRPPIAFDWYRSIIQFMLDSGWYIWFAKFIAIGEMVIGIALIAGLFIGLTAFFSGFMNWNFVMAGTASVNGVFLVLAFLLISAWKVAGYLGLDYYLLPRIAKWWAPTKVAK